MTLNGIYQLSQVLGISSIIFVWMAFFLRALHINCNLNNIPRNIKEKFLGFFLGKRLILNIDGVWCIGRGWFDKHSRILHAFHGPEWAEKLLHDGQCITINFELSEKELLDEVIKLNIRDLKRSNPNGMDNRRKFYLNDDDDDYILPLNRRIEHLND